MNKDSKMLVIGMLVAASLPLTTTSAEAVHARKLIASTEHATSTRMMKGRLVKELVEADDLMMKGKWADAADRYHDAINHDSQNVAAHTGLGMALGKQFKLEAAEQEFDKALAIDPQNAMAHVGKAMVDVNRLQSSSATVQKARDAMLQDAVSQAQQAIQLDATMPEAHYYLAQALRSQGQLDGAAQEFRTAIQNEPFYSDAYAGLGLVRLDQNSPVEAAANFKQAIAINSGNSTAHYGLGRVDLQQGQVDDAIHELNTALYQFPNSAPVRLTLGEAYLQQGNTVAAIREFQESIRIKPETPEAYLHIAGVRESRGDIEHAIAELRSGLELMPGNPDLTERVADNSLRIDKLDDAIKGYSSVLQTNPQNAQAAKGLTRAFYLKSQRDAAGAYFMSNDFAGAKRMLDKAVAMNPNDMELRLAQAKLRALSGEKIDLATVGQPRTDGERLAYAEALLAQNRFPEAHQQINALIGNARDAKQTLAVADMALMIKDLDSAEAAYKKAQSFPDAQDRAKAGLDQVAQARETARQDWTLASDLAHKNALNSAVDKYRSAIFGNPELANARIGLAQALEKRDTHSPQSLREAAAQYRVYLALSPQLQTKQTEKINKRIVHLNDRAGKLEQKLALKSNQTR